MSEAKRDFRVAEASRVGPAGQEPEAAGSGAVLGGKTRRPYQRPCVQKRRSVHQATLVSSGGTSGTLTSGGP